MTDACTTDLPENLQYLEILSVPNSTCWALKKKHFTFPQCSCLNLAGCQGTQQATLSLPSSAGQGEKIR